MKRTVSEGQAIKVVDEFGVLRDALVTRSWSPATNGIVEYDDAVEGGVKLAINIVYVSSDPKRTDQYGQQKEHLCSVSHRTVRGDCPGRYWYQE